jgi:hypothetical protein
MSNINFQNYFINFYIQSKIFFTNISHSISYVAYKVKEKLNFDYSNLNVKEPCSDLEKISTYEYDKHTSSLLEDNNDIESNN